MFNKEDFKYSTISYIWAYKTTLKHKITNDIVYSQLLVLLYIIILLGQDKIYTNKKWTYQPAFDSQNVWIQNKS